MAETACRPRSTRFAVTARKPDSRRDGNGVRGDGRLSANPWPDLRPPIRRSGDHRRSGNRRSRDSGRLARDGTNRRRRRRRRFDGGHRRRGQIDPPGHPSRRCRTYRCADGRPAASPPGGRCAATKSHRRRRSRRAVRLARLAAEIERHVDDVVLVTDDEIRDALLLVLDRRNCWSNRPARPRPPRCSPAKSPCRPARRRSPPSAAAISTATA